MSGLKVLVVYYSRSGATRKVAEDLAYLFDADCEELKLTHEPGGLWAELRLRMDTAFERPVEIEATRFDPFLYDLVVIGTPVWSGYLAAPIRKWLDQRGCRLQTSGLFAVHDGCGGANAFRSMAEMLNHEPLATFEVPEWETRGEAYQSKLCQFTRFLRRRACLFSSLQSEMWSPSV